MFFIKVILLDIKISFYLEYRWKLILFNTETKNRKSTFGTVSSCAGSVGYAAVTNFTPAKILKVKSAIKTVRGATKFIKKWNLLIKLLEKLGKEKKAVKAVAKKAARKAGPDTREALLDLFGVTTIVSACSALFEK